MVGLEFVVKINKDDLLEFLNSHAQDGVDVFGQLPEDEKIEINIIMTDGYSNVKFELSCETE